MKSIKNCKKKFVRNLLPKSEEYYKNQGLMLRGKGEWRDAICPFHTDTKPSLRVKAESGAYRCMVCGARGGDVIAFHQHLHNMGFIDACKALGAWKELV